MDERTLALVKGLKEICDLDEGRRDLAGILSRAAATVRELLDVPLAYGAATTESQSQVAMATEDSPVTRIEVWNGPGRLGEAVIGTREPALWSKGKTPEPSGPDLLDFFGAGSWIGVPLPLADRPAGVLVATREDATPFSDRDRDLMAAIADTAATAIANMRTFQEIETLTVTDELTRIYNYRFLKAALQREVERASRYGQVFSILMLDVDHLKMYNEDHGHLGGSELLRSIAAILAEQSRAIDLVAKYGGDEFLIILPQTSTDGAATMGTRICKAVAEADLPYCEKGQITVSAGVASFPQHGASMEALLAAADEALFAAKRNGRNRVETATGPGQPGRITKPAA